MDSQLLELLCYFSSHTTEFGERCPTIDFVHHLRGNLNLAVAMRHSFIEVLQEDFQVYTMGNSAVFDRLSLSSKTANALHVEFSEDLNGIRIGPQYFIEGHILCDLRHVRPFQKNTALAFL